MTKNDRDTTLAEIKKLPIEFCKERGWQYNQTPKGLAISISLEAAELLEHFQWTDYNEKDLPEITSELADVLIYCLELSDMLDIDIATAIKEKLNKAAEKYPIEAFNGDRAADFETYRKLKLDHRKSKRNNNDAR